MQMGTVERLMWAKMIDDTLLEAYISQARASILAHAMRALVDFNRVVPKKSKTVRQFIFGE